MYSWTWKDICACIQSCPHLSPPCLLLCLCIQLCAYPCLHIGPYLCPCPYPHNPVPTPIPLTSTPTPMPTPMPILVPIRMPLPTPFPCPCRSLCSSSHPHHRPHPHAHGYDVWHILLIFNRLWLSLFIYHDVIPLKCVMKMECDLLFVQQEKKRISIIFFDDCIWVLWFCSWLNSCFPTPVVLLIMVRHLLSVTYHMFYCNLW